MLILAIDSAHKNGSVTLARARAADGDCAVQETAMVDGGTFSAQLIPTIAALLARHKFNKNDIEVIAAATGPGSFTGLRIGLAAVKGLAEALKKPIVGVSMLEAIAREGLSPTGKTFAILDAGRSEVYVGEYAGSEKMAEYLCSREELISRVKKDGAVLVRTSDENLSALLAENNVTAEVVAYPGSEAVARLGWEKFAAGQSTTVDELEANYVRRDESLFAKQ